MIVGGIGVQDLKRKQRLIGLDLFRIIAAIMVMLFHSSIHIGCNYGILQPFISMGAIFMTGFFVLSGFSLYYVHGGDDYTDINIIKRFLLKRLIGILPLYYVVSILYILFLGKETLIQNIALFPIELLGIQTMFSSLFEISHNGGTWFISCILVCYLVFPFIAICVRQMKIKGKLLLGLLSTFILLYSPFVQHMFHTQSIYSNPLFRILEFTIGCILASEAFHVHKCKAGKIISSKYLLLIEVLILVICVSIVYELGIAPGNYMLYSWICLPAFSLIILGLANLECERPNNPKLLLYLSAISYAFFLTQFFVWPIIKKMNISSNWLKTIVSVVLCTVIATVMHEMIEKPCKSILTRKLLKR